MHSSRSLLMSLALLAPLVPATVFSQVDPSLLSGLKYRLIGPFRGGRSLAVCGSKQRPTEFFMGATGGGIWKTTDSGANWSCVSDGYLGSSSVGAIAIAASNPDVIFAGTGERDIRGDISEGDGLYRSADDGKTWTRAGLENTRTISRIQIDPSNPDVVYVAALGHIYGRNPERGVFKSSDAGKTWTRVLFVDDRSGAVDLAMDPAHPETLYAATWEAWRTPYSLSSGGPGSRLFKTTDGGKTWRDLSRAPGMPKGVLGKIGLSVSPVDSNRVWANVEAEDGGIFVSDDAGSTWKRTSDDREWRQRAWYYTHIYADSKDKDTVYVLNVGAGKSTDGGKTFHGFRAPHGDNHDLWIAPDNPERMIESNDGGAAVSTDGGRTWTAEDMPTGQFYHVSADNDFPFHLLGAQQDSSSVRIASEGRGAGIGPTDWTSTAGGESGFVVAKPSNPDLVFGGNYGGNVEEFNHRTNVSRSVDPWPDNPMGHAAIDIEDRFQWTFPIVFSPNDPNVLYTASQYIYETTNDGNSWTRISPDLTRHDPSTLQSSGGPITKDNTSVEYYGKVFALAESPVTPGTIWAGSDDGLVHVTRSGGASWSDVTPKNMPKWGRVSTVEASPTDEGTAYLAVNNYQNDDPAPYLYRTHDFGRTWTKIVNGLPANAFARAIRQDPVRRGLLYAGTETGLFVSFDDGDHWQPLQLNLPLCPVHDLIVKNDDLLVATHGRAFWILDDLSPLRQIGSAPTRPTLFTPDSAIEGSRGFGGFFRGRGNVKLGQNPPSGIVLDYYLPAKADDVKIEFTDDSGKVFQTQDLGSQDTGAHRTSVVLRYPSFRTFPGMVLWSGFSSPISAPPGDYGVRLIAGSQSDSTTAHLLPDPRGGNPADLRAQFELSEQIIGRLDAANDAVVKIRDLRSKLSTLAKARPEFAGEAGRLMARSAPIEEAIYQTKSKTGEDPLNYPIMLNDRLAGLLSNVQSGPFRPTRQSYRVFEVLSGLLQVQLDKLQPILGSDLEDLNTRLRAKNISPIQLVDPTKAAPEQRGRRG